MPALTAPAMRITIEYNSTVDVGTLAVDHPSLRFAALLGPSGVTLAGSAQTLRITQAGGLSPLAWSATADQSWLVVTPSSASGTATLTVTINAAAVPFVTGPLLGKVTVATADNPQILSPIGVTLTVSLATAAAVPFGSFDTPSDGAAGLNGSIAVTGWALDDIEVTRVRILRDPVAGEPAGVPVFIGNAVLVDGARPDVAAAYPQMPRSTRGGWGYLLLTNMLPGQGTGTFRLYAYADDADGHTTLLGTKTITCDNADATSPFGAIDTPGQGDVVSGVVPNFGWVLAPGLLRADPPGGGNVTVYVDGAPVGSPAGWTSRSDLSTLFPASQYSGVDTALAVYSLDTTVLANGVHTIAWAVTDNLGVTSGIGSRFFTVSNGALIGSNAAASSNVVESAVVANAEPAGGAHANAGTILLGRVGFDPNAPLSYFFPDRDGVVTIAVHELDRIELEFEPGATGVMITPKGDRPLPAGALIDPITGLFTWAPGPGFIGKYELAFGDRRVRITIEPGK